MTPVLIFETSVVQINIEIVVTKCVFDNWYFFKNSVCGRRPHRWSFKKIFPLPSSDGEGKTFPLHSPRPNLLQITGSVKDVGNVALNYLNPTHAIDSREQIWKDSDGQTRLLQTDKCSGLSPDYVRRRCK